MPTFRLTIEYDGTRFSGWQSQPGGIRTVQGALEEALATVLRFPVRIQGAGRTDAGVHALGQVTSFDAETEISPERFVRSLTALVRPEVAVVDAAIAPPGFNARFDSTGKHYRYYLLPRGAPSPLYRHMCLFIPGRFDPGRMEEAASMMVGEHDFAGFRASDCERKTTRRTLYELTIGQEAGLVCVDVKGDGFLKNMVRVIVGTLVDIGRGRLHPDIVQEVFRTGDRRMAGPTAPARGLVLREVYYPSGWIRERKDPS